MDVGISYVLCNTGEDIKRVYQQVKSIAIMYKYKFKCNSWVGLAKDEASSNLVDVAFFISFPWMKDEVVEKLVNEYDEKIEKISKC